MSDPQKPNIGDLNSNERGTGARFNAGKTPLELVPLYVMARQLNPTTDAQQHVRLALMSLGEFQARMGDDEVSLHRAWSYAMHAAYMSDAEMFAATARVLEYGAKKYDEWNWSKGIPWQSVIGCAARHLLGTPEHPGMWQDPLGIDHESGQPHVGHVGCNLAFLLQYLSTFREGDDRPKMLTLPPF